MCGHPMLAIVIPTQNRHGSRPNNPAVCRRCHFRAWITVEPGKPLLRLQGIDERTEAAS
jgi:hypothetical protein